MGRGWDEDVVNGVDDVVFGEDVVVDDFGDDVDFDGE